MIYLYVFGSLALIIGGLFTAAKIQGARAEKFKARALEQAQADRVKSAQVAIAQASKTAAAVSVVKESLITEQQAGQAKFDAGDRDFMNKDTF